jgi:hypothetical protein
MNITLLIMVLAFAFIALWALNRFGMQRKGSVLKRGKDRVRRLTLLERLMVPWLMAMEMLSSVWHRCWPADNRIALANELATIDEHGIETQMIDPASANLPVAQRYLLYSRGATGAGYVDLCAQNTLPLGPSSDSPYQIGDYVGIRRLGSRPGLEIGIPATAINVDDLVLTAAGGKVQAFTGAANGTYYIVGRACKTTPATAIEVAYVPETPRKITMNGGTATETIA